MAVKLTIMSTDALLTNEVKFTLYRWPVSKCGSKVDFPIIIINAF